MNKQHVFRFLLAGAAALLIAVALVASAVASTARISAQSASAYTQLYGDFHDVVAASSSQVRTDQFAFQKTTGPCLTRTLTALFVAQSPGSTDATPAKAAYKPLLYEAVFQMIMQSARPLVTPYLRAIKLAIEISGLTGPKRAQAVQFEQAFDQAASLRTCADANTWAAADYSPGREPVGVKLTSKLAAALGSTFTSSGHNIKGATSTQETAFKKLVKQANQRFESVVKQIESRGTYWLALVVLKAKQDATKQTTTTTTTTTTATTTTPTTSTSTAPTTTTS